MEGDISKSWRTIRDQPLSEKRMHTYRRVMEAEARLEHVRRRQGIRETAIAEALNAVDPDVPGTNPEDDIFLSTISRYVAELGGRVEVRAVFPDETITLLREPEDQGRQSAP